MANFKINFFSLIEETLFEAEADRLRELLDGLGKARRHSGDIRGIAQFTLQTKLSEEEICNAVVKLNLDGGFSCKEEDHEEMEPA